MLTVTDSAQEMIKGYMTQQSVSSALRVYLSSGG